MTEEMKVIPTNGTSADDVKYAKRVEEIYINGINVTGCEFCKPNPLYKTEYSCHCRGYIQDDGLHVHLSCEHNPNCYYKQLKRLEQENKELKEMLSKEPKAMQAFQIAYSGLKKENEVLWGMVKDYKSALEEINLILDELKQQYDYMTDYSEIKEIQDRINEVLQ